MIILSTEHTFVLKPSSKSTVTNSLQKCDHCTQIWVQRSHFSRLLVSVDFDDGFNTKVCSIDHTIIVVYINGVSYRGSSKMSQIWVQWSHFSRLLVTVDFDDGFNTKVCSIDHTIIVVYINGVSHRGSSEIPLQEIESWIWQLSENLSDYCVDHSRQYINLSLNCGINLRIFKKHILPNANAFLKFWSIWTLNNLDFQSLWTEYMELWAKILGLGTGTCELTNRDTIAWIYPEFSLKIVTLKNE